jgi:hypothetical protein
MPTDGSVLRHVAWDYVNKKLKWFDNAGAEIAALTNLSTFACRIEVIGV